MAKINIQHIADSVGVSRISVWKALNNKPGVSEQTRAKILELAEQMQSSTNSLKDFSERTFSIVVSRPESSVFWMQIIHHMAKELTKHNINLMYTYLPTEYKKGFVLPQSIAPEIIDGFAVLNIYDKNMVDILSTNPLPKVFFDTRPNIPLNKLNGDLMLIEGRESVKDITLKLIDMRFKNISFIGDISYARTNNDRYLGFCEAHALRKLKINKELNMLGPLSLSNHYEEISSFLNNLEALPDAIVCVSDFIAHFVKRYVDENNIKTNIIITGFDNSIEYANISNSITSVEVETAILGKRLARKLIFRCDYKNSPLELSYINTKPVFRGNMQ